MLVIYIAGPMTGIENDNREEFLRAEACLRKAGVESGIEVEIFNPIMLPRRLKDAYYMPICTAMIDASDALFMLDGWENSPGALAEYYYGKRQGKSVLTKRSFHKGENDGKIDA